jgi:GNAT superfamily N-acetyltransferase
MIREISADVLRHDFFALLGEVEAGRIFDGSNADHVVWLERLIAARELLGARTFADYDDAGEPIGFITVLFGQGPPGGIAYEHRVEILDLGLVASHRGRGVGARLLAHAEDEARTGKFTCIFVATYAGERRAVAFYLREGYVPVATLPDVHGPGDEGMVYLRKRLPVPSSSDARGR